MLRRRTRRQRLPPARGEPPAAKGNGSTAATLLAPPVLLIRVRQLRARALCAERRSCLASALSVSLIAAAVASMVPAVAG